MATSVHTHQWGLVRVHHCMGFDLDTCVHECVAFIIMHYGHAADACARKHASIRVHIVCTALVGAFV